jgi:hypothetical protein
MKRCKSAGFSTFLRGCNPVSGKPRNLNQSTFGVKNKTIFHKAENTFTFARCKLI